MATLIMKTLDLAACGFTRRLLIALITSSLDQTVEGLNIIRVNRGQMPADGVNPVGLHADDFDHVGIVLGPARGEFEFDQSLQRARNANARAWPPICTGWGIVVGAGLESVPGRPPSGKMSTLTSVSLWRTLGQRPTGWGSTSKPDTLANCKNSSIRAAGKTMSTSCVMRQKAVVPHRPAAPQDRLAGHDLQQAIERVDNAAIAPRQILGFEHSFPADEQLFADGELLGQKLQRKRHELLPPRDSRPCALRTPERY